MRLSCEKEKETANCVTAFLLYYLTYFYITVRYFYPDLLSLKCFNKK